MTSNSLPVTDEPNRAKDYSKEMPPRASGGPSFGLLANHLLSSPPTSFARSHGYLRQKESDRSCDSLSRLYTSLDESAYSINRPSSYLSTVSTNLPRTHLGFLQHQFLWFEPGIPVCQDVFKMPINRHRGISLSSSSEFDYPTYL